MRSRVDHLPKYGEPGYSVTGVEVFGQVVEPVNDDLALVIRRRCGSCKGYGLKETPEHRAWAAGVASRVDRLMDLRGHAGNAESLEAKREQGTEPTPAWQDCGRCGGLGWKEAELTMAELGRMLIDRLRVRVKKGKARLEVKR